FPSSASPSTSTYTLSLHDALPISKYNRVVIPANTPIPAAGSTISRTIKEGQSGIIEEITEGDDEDLEHVRQLGEQTLDLGRPYRSEEHTSELQSRFDLVCRLLLEK